MPKIQIYPPSRWHNFGVIVPSARLFFLNCESSGGDSLRIRFKVVSKLRANCKKATLNKRESLYRYVRKPSQA